MSDKVRFSAKKHRAITALMTERNLQDAAESAGVGPRQMRRWMRDPVFQAELAAVAAQATDTAVRRLTGMTEGALDTLEWARQFATEHDHAKVRAALGLLSNFTKMKELLDLELRMAALEATVRGGVK